MLHRLTRRAGFRLSAVNVGVFAVVCLIEVFSRIGLLGAGATVGFLDAVRLPSTVGSLLRVPWTALTYMFVQYEPGHLVMNLLLLLLFGRIVGVESGRRGRVTAIYLLGGLAGAGGYIAFAPASAPGLVGCSASVFALMGWTLSAVPGRRVRLWGFGEVRLWAVVSFLLLVFFFGNYGATFGSQAAHLAGLACGCCCGLFERVADRRRYRNQRAAEADEAAEKTLDELLDKVRRSGYESLTQTERSRLFYVSSNQGGRR